MKICRWCHQPIRLHAQTGLWTANTDTVTGTCWKNYRPGDNDPDNARHVPLEDS